MSRRHPPELPGPLPHRQTAERWSGFVFAQDADSGTPAAQVAPVDVTQVPTVTQQPALDEHALARKVMHLLRQRLRIDQERTGQG